MHKGSFPYVLLPKAGCPLWGHPCTSRTPKILHLSCALPPPPTWPDTWHSSKAHEICQCGRIGGMTSALALNIKVGKILKNFCFYSNKMVRKPQDHIFLSSQVLPPYHLHSLHNLYEEDN
jgi:hypothetical protein